MSFLHFFAVFYEKYSDLPQIVFQCKKCSEKTAGNGTQRKTVIFTADIFAVHSKPHILFNKKRTSQDFNTKTLPDNDDPVPLTFTFQEAPVFSIFKQ